MAISTPLEIYQFPCLSDNYGYLVHDSANNLTATIDTPEVAPINAALAAKGWSLTHIMNTHHHYDHAGGNIELKEQWGCTIVGSKSDAKRIPGIDVEVADGGTYDFGGHTAKVFDVSGHTQGHIAFYFEQDAILFSGDALFALGCGRLFEGTPAQMWESLQKLLVLPDDTTVYCAHEYTAANAKFALHADPDNAELALYAARIEEKRARGEPTVPTLLSRELATNPFLRADDADLRDRWGGSSPADTFAALRAAKDSF